MKGRYRVVNPIRFFVFILIAVCTLSFTIFSFLNHESVQAASMNTLKQVSVEQYGNLWNIAENFCPNDKDPRVFIQEICEINDIDNTDYLYDGDILFIPVENNC